MQELLALPGPQLGSSGVQQSQDEDAIYFSSGGDQHSRDTLAFQNEGTVSFRGMQ